MNFDINKYEKSVIDNLDINNIKKIIDFLVLSKCDYIDELLEDYLDIFTLEYNEFTEKFNKLNKEYNNNLIEEIKNDMNIIEKIYNI